MNHEHTWEVWCRDIWSVSAVENLPMEKLLSEPMYTYRWCTTPGCYAFQKGVEHVKTTRTFLLTRERPLMKSLEDMESHDRMYPVGEKGKMPVQ